MVLTCAMPWVKKSLHLPWCIFPDILKTHFCLIHTDVLWACRYVHHIVWLVFIEARRHWNPDPGVTGCSELQYGCWKLNLNWRERGTLWEQQVLLTTGLSLQLHFSVSFHHGCGTFRKSLLVVLIFWRNSFVLLKPINNVSIFSWKYDFWEDKIWNYASWNPKLCLLIPVGLALM